MDHLRPVEREKISKMSEDRVRRQLEEEGWSGEQLEGVPLAQLKEALARVRVQQYEADFQMQGAVSGEFPNVGEITDHENDSVKITEMKLAFEREKLVAELELKRLELQEMSGLKRQELRIMEEKTEVEKQKMESKVYTAKLFSDALRGTMTKMPSDPIDMIPYFCTVERLFADFNVAPELKVNLLKPHLTVQARMLIAKMDPVKCSNYDEVKKLLHKFKLSSSALLEKFNSPERGANKTYTLFGDRLMSVLTYYVDNRNARSHDQTIVGMR